MNRINITSQALKRIRHTILFIDSQVRSMELSRSILKRLNKYYDELKIDEDRLLTILSMGRGEMRILDEEGDRHDTTESTMV